MNTNALERTYLRRMFSPAAEHASDLLVGREGGRRNTLLIVEVNRCWI